VVVAPAPPSTTASAVSTATTSDSVYRVQRGDTLSAIAASHGTTVAALIQINGLSNPNYIYAGQQIRLP
jgi:LysM repeat protein